jgi:dTDP-4-amino-4,6-dideoxygalactose transaminase
LKVPFLDLSKQWEVIGPEAVTAMETVLRRGNFILGGEVAEFEQAFAAFCDATHGIGVASGLDAIKLGLRALGVQPGDEVITAANTFIATALAASSIGARPVLVDMDPESYNMDVRQIEGALTPRTRGIIPVHLYGQAADLDPILALAKRHNLFVLEDASQAHGARYHGRRVGTFGELAAFSLYPGKNLGAAGDAGVVVTNNDQLAQRLRVLRNYGSERKYYHEELGENSRLDTLQAAFLKTKIPHLDAWNQQRRAAARRYTDLLAGVGDLILPRTMAYGEHVFHLYVIQTARRDALLQHLQQRDVGCIIHYPVPIHLQKAYAHAGWKPGDFPVAEKYARQTLSLPMFPGITVEQQDYVAKCIREFFG